MKRPSTSGGRTKGGRPSNAGGAGDAEQYQDGAAASGHMRERDSGLQGVFESSDWLEVFYGRQFDLEERASLDAAISFRDAYERLNRDKGTNAPGLLNLPCIRIGSNGVSRLASLLQSRRRQLEAEEARLLAEERDDRLMRAGENRSGEGGGSPSGGGESRQPVFPAAGGVASADLCIVRKRLARANVTAADLSANVIGDFGVAAARQLLAGMPDLTSLNLAYNGIGTDGCRQIAEELSTQSSDSDLMSLIHRKQKETEEKGGGKKGKDKSKGAVVTASSKDRDSGRIQLPTNPKERERLREQTRRGLETLILGSPEVPSDPLAGTNNDLGAGGLEAIVGGLQGVPDGVPCLRFLSLSGTGLGPECGETLAALLQSCPLLAGLDVSCNPLGPEGLVCFLPFARQLTSLDIQRTGLEGPLVSAGLRQLICENPNLRALNLGRNKLGSGVLRRVLRAMTSADGVSFFGLADSAIDAAGILAICAAAAPAVLQQQETVVAETKHMRTAEQPEGGQSGIGIEGPEVLSGSLVASFAEGGDTSGDAKGDLVRATEGGSVIVGNEEPLEALRTSDPSSEVPPSLPPTFDIPFSSLGSHLQTLDLSDNPGAFADKTAVMGLVIALPHMLLHCLKLNRNPIGDAGCAAIGLALDPARAPSTTLGVLEMNACRIGESGVLGLLTSLQKNERLHVLKLNGNFVDASAENEIVRLLQDNRALCTLSLLGGRLSSQCKQRIAAITTRNMKEVDGAEAREQRLAVWRLREEKESLEAVRRLVSKIRLKISAAKREKDETEREQVQLLDEEISKRLELEKILAMEERRLEEQQHSVKETEDEFRRAKQTLSTRVAQAQAEAAAEQNALKEVQRKEKAVTDMMAEANGEMPEKVAAFEKRIKELEKEEDDLRQETEEARAVIAKLSVQINETVAAIGGAINRETNVKEVGTKKGKK